MSALNLERAAGATIVPEALERVIRHRLETRPDDRFQSAKDVVFALREATAGNIWMIDGLK